MFELDSDFDGVGKQHVCGSADVDGEIFSVVDSAGFTDEDLGPDRVVHQIRTLIKLADPGPHVFVLVLKIGSLSRKDSHLIQILTQLFDGELSKFTLVLFTHGDALGTQSLDQKVRSSRRVCELVSVCGGRYCVLDNTQKGDRQQVRLVLAQIDAIIRGNGGRHCSSETVVLGFRDHRGQMLGDGFWTRELRRFCPQGYSAAQKPGLCGLHSAQPNLKSAAVQVLFCLIRLGLLLLPEVSWI